ncbi:MAG: hypothetical protein H0V27_14835 [Pyrinomonadaceae bacterium]|nr:hypothetical protein [Pyrinomonadaceae bacterium]
MNTKSSIHHFAVLLLRVALVFVLVAALWLIYRGLPDNGERDTRFGGEAGTRTETQLRIVLQLPAFDAAQLAEATLELYPFDLAAAQREFYFERRAGQRFDDFLQQRLKNNPAVKGRFGAGGETLIGVPPGRWWIYATVPNRDEVTSWRLPVNVSGREQTAELTAQNAYTKAKNF